MAKIQDQLMVQVQQEDRQEADVETINPKSRQNAFISRAASS